MNVVSTLGTDQLYALDNVEPRWQVREAPAPPSPVFLDEISDFYRLHYATGLDKLFETSWYSTYGFARLQQDHMLLDFVGQCSEQMKLAADSTFSVQATQSLEARLVWQLSILPRAAASQDTRLNDAQLSGLLPRIDTVETLLTGQFLPMVQVPSPPGPDHAADHRKHNEMHFWHQLGRFAAVHDDDSASDSASREVTESISAMRSVLGMMENRDVLYSLALMRYFGGRLPGFDPSTPLEKSGHSEMAIDKLETARSFVAFEAERGTTQVVQRICGMAMRGAVLQRS